MGSRDSVPEVTASWGQSTRWRVPWAALACLACASCYTGIQRTDEVLLTGEIDPSGNAPDTDLSVANHSYDLTVGRYFGKFEAFGGLGISLQDYNQRTRTSASGESASSGRLVLGGAYRLANLEGFEVSALGSVASISGGSTGLAMSADSSIRSAITLGAQVSTRTLMEGGTGWIPVVRLGITSLSGTAAPLGYVADDGSQDFSGVAIMASMGINYYLQLGGRRDD